MASFIESHRRLNFDSVFKNFNNIKKRCDVPVIPDVISAARENGNSSRRNERDILIAVIRDGNLHDLSLFIRYGREDENGNLKSVTDAPCGLLPEESRFKLSLVFRSELAQRKAQRGLKSDAVDIKPEVT